MDLLGDLGTADQLTSVRAENKVLKEKVKALEQRCKVLTVENETLKAELEIWREEGGTPGASSTAVADTAMTETQDFGKDHFLQGGNGVYAKSCQALLEKLHGMANPTCCSLSQDDTLLATGGADRQVVLAPWGLALGDSTTSPPAPATLENILRFECQAPVISIDFARKPRSPFLAAGCMDGSVHVLHIMSQSPLACQEVAKGTIKHPKYIRSVAWSSRENVLATSSADGTVQIHRIVWNGWDETNIQLQKVQALNLSGPVESMCFHKDQLVCYVRGTPYLSIFDLSPILEVASGSEAMAPPTLEHTKMNLNQGPGNAGFVDHVSFCVMDMVPHGDYLALATDASRNIILEVASGKLVRNLYGHKNDGFSTPKIGWSANGQYLFGNHQDEATIMVWDIASGSIVERLSGHGNSIRDLYSSPSSNTLVSTSFDKKTLVWLEES